MCKTKLVSGLALRSEIGAWARAREWLWNDGKAIDESVDWTVLFAGCGAGNGIPDCGSRSQKC